VLQSIRRTLVAAEVALMHVACAAAEPRPPPAADTGAEIGSPNDMDAGAGEAARAGRDSPSEGDGFGASSDGSDATVSGLDAADGDAGDGGSGPQPAVPGKPGFALTAGGNVSTSRSYKLVGAVGEAPGGNTIGKSPSYILQGGVVAGTQ
jgi:hypothetical protein